MRPTPIGILRRAAAIAACSAVVGCSAGASSFEPTFTATSTAAPSAAVVGSPSATVVPLETARPPAPSVSPAPPTPAVTTSPETPTRSPAPPSVKLGTVVETWWTTSGSAPSPASPTRLSTSLSCRRAPSSLSSTAPSRDRGTSGSGLRSCRHLIFPSGWVAAEGRDGEAWLGQSDGTARRFRTTSARSPPCPAGSVSRASRGFPSPFRARLFEANGDVDPGDDWIDPTWLFSTFVLNMIFEPSAVRREGPSLPLLPDPAGHYPGRLDGFPLPAELPVGRVRRRRPLDYSARCQDHRHVRPSGRPDLHVGQLRRAGCGGGLPFDPAVAWCRLEFAVTRIVVP